MILFFFLILNGSDNMTGLQAKNNRVINGGTIEIILMSEEITNLKFY